MTYKIAFVQIENSDGIYPCNCPRSDIQAGDQVLLSMPNQEPPVKIAKVCHLEYLDYQCRNTIVCQSCESVYYRPTGDFYIRDPNPDARREPTRADLVEVLALLGWSSGIPIMSTYDKAFWQSDGMRTALVLLRKNGVDLQLIDKAWAPDVRADGRIRVRPTVGRTVRNFFFRSKTNIFEAAFLFAVDFTNGHSLDKYFVEQGHSREIRSPRYDGRPHHSFGSGECETQVYEDGYDELREIYQAIAHADGEPAYLSDGVYLMPDGRLVDG